VSRAVDQSTTTRPVSLSTACRERDWPGLELLHRLQDGLPYVTVPPGHVIDWNDPNVKRSLDVAAGTVQILRGVLSTDAGVGFDIVTVVVKVLLPAPAPDASKVGKRGPNAGRQRAEDILRKLYPDPANFPPNEAISKAALRRAVEQEWKSTPNPLHIPLPSPDVIDRVIDELRRPSSHIS
jgi:hypothetical protein